jgi:hypothetical protein
MRWGWAIKARFSFLDVVVISLIGGFLRAAISDLL